MADGSRSSAIEIEAEVAAAEAAREAKAEVLEREGIEASRAEGEQARRALPARPNGTSSPSTSGSPT